MALVVQVAAEMARADAASEAIEARRSADRDRKAKQRATVTGSHVTVRDSADIPPSPVPLSSSPRPLTPNPLTPIPQHKSEGRATSKSMAHRLPSDWEPRPLTATMQATVDRWNPGELESQLQRFRDHWAASATPTAKKHDWQAAWRTWIGKHNDDRPQRVSMGRNDRLPPERPTESSNPRILAGIANRNRILAEQADHDARNAA